MDLSRLLRPGSVAVVGASERDGSYAGDTLLNLNAAGFPGPVWGVNPNRTEAHGRPCFASLSDLPEVPDAVVVGIPAAGVPDVVEEAGALGCGGAVIYGAGFGEVASGVEHERRLAEAASRHSLPVCGPNGNGIVSLHAGVTLWGDTLRELTPGPVALVSQSGNVAVNALATRRGLRLHTVVSCGNSVMIDPAEWLAALAQEQGVGSIALYLEADGDGAALCEALAVCAERDVGVAVLKVGTSAAGAAAAAAHTGAIAGDQRIFRALVEEAGAAWAADVHDLLELAKSLAVPGARSAAGTGATGARATPSAAGAGVATAARAARGGLAILTCSGGDSALAADECERLGLGLPPLAPATAERLRGLLPEAATVGNPLDYTALIWGEVERLRDIVVTVGEDPAIERVLVFYDQAADVGAAERSWAAVREGIRLGAEHCSVPVIVSSTLPELLDEDAAVGLIDAGVPAVAGLRTGLACAAALSQPQGDSKRLRAIGAAAAAARASGARASGTRTAGGAAGAHAPDGAAGARAPDGAAGARAPDGAAGARAGPSRAPDNGAGWLSEHEAKELLRAGGLPVVEGRLVSGEDDAAAALSELGGRVALKLAGPSVRHKAELGALALDVSTEAEARAAHRRLVALGVADAGVLVERMAPPGAELLVAARTDGVVPCVVVAAGGIWTEALADAAVVPLPVSPERVERAIRRLRAAALFTGGRGRPPLDVPAAAQLASAAGEILLENRLELLELNPVLVYERGVVVVDALAATR